MDEVLVGYHLYVKGSVTRVGIGLYPEQGVEPLNYSFFRMTTPSLRKPKTKSVSVAAVSSVKEQEMKKGKKVSVVADRVVEESESENDSDMSDNDEHFSGSESEEDNEDTTEGADGANKNPNKKSKSESRLEAKKVKLERQAHRPHNDLVQDAKKLWERVRRRDLKQAERSEPMKELFGLLGGKFKEIIMKHDASRMIQTCVKYGSPEQRLQIATELKGAYAEIAKSRYGKHIVKRLLQYCPSVRKSIVSEFRGQVGKLIRHVDASAVLEEIYSEYANGRDRNALLLEFYGPEFILFQKRSETEAIPSLADILQGATMEKKEKVMKYLREALDGLVNKGSLQHTMIHRLMLEYVQNEETAKLQDWISTVEGQLVEILHTMEGARVVSKCLAVATAKQRKNIIKSFKTFVGKICKEEYGHQVMLVAFAVVDDTVLMRSVVISEICKNLKEYLSDKHASRLVVYLLATCSDSVNSVLGCQAVQLLRDSISAAVSAGTSKKDANLRSKELLTDLIEPLSDLICASELEELGCDASFRFENMLTDTTKQALLLEASLALPAVTDKLLQGPASSAQTYDEPEFRSLMKKFARKCTEDQGRKYLDLIAPIMKELIESEAAYVLAVMVSSKPQLKELIVKDCGSKNEHSVAFYQKL